MSKCQIITLCVQRDNQPMELVGRRLQEICFRHSKRFVYIDAVSGKVNFNHLSEFSREGIQQVLFTSSPLAQVTLISQQRYFKHSITEAFCKRKHMLKLQIGILMAAEQKEESCIRHRMNSEKDSDFLNIISKSTCAFIYLLTTLFLFLLQQFQIIYIAC